MKAPPRLAALCAPLFALAGLATCGGGSGTPNGRGGTSGGGTGGSSATGGIGGAAGAGGSPATSTIQSHSASLVANAAGTQLYAVHPDADSVSILDLGTRQVLHDVALAPSPPTPDSSGRYTPAIAPRALALESTGHTLYVTGQRSGSVYAVDVSGGTVTRSAAVCSEPIGILVSADNANLFVACAQDDEVVELAAADLSVAASVACPRKPWALAWGADGVTLYAT
ncbi:MAG TPA: hypothetical protein VHG72_13140, partial [Polyangia bacterium]|nr:hypothetical protein [Polyangia bacterium]